MTHQQAVDTLASERYLLDEMREPERFEFEAHYFDCEECAEEVRLAHMIREEAVGGGAAATRIAVETADANVVAGSTRSDSNVVSGFSRTDEAVVSGVPGHRSAEPQDGTARPAKVLPFWRRPATAVPWAAAAALALMVSYQSLVTVPELRSSVAPQAITPIVLRGATRGTVPVVTIAPGQRFVTVALDVMSGPDARALRYEVGPAGKPAAFSGEAPVPASGSPLMLLLPAAELQRGARYSLIVRGAGSANAVIGEYQFDVS